ncbi:hypothetical protein FGB62_85g13 [Gracilaria domingensis]|nr:hypothetical protein FGB62_85g13 [Gracilaria domingensis]
MFLGAAGEAYFFNPDAAVVSATALDFDVDAPQHIALQHASHALHPPSFDLPTKAATQQLPSTSQLFPPPSSSSSPTAQPSVPSHSVPSDFDPSCSAVAIVPTQVAPPDLVPSDRRFEYCSDSDVELTRAERDGTAQVARTTHSPPICLSDRSDRKWSTAVTVSFAQFHLQRSLAATVSDNHPSPPPSSDAQPADDFSEALFDLPATPPPKRSSSRSPQLRQNDPADQPSVIAPAFSSDDAQSPPTTPTPVHTNATSVQAPHSADELSPAQGAASVADREGSPATPQVQTPSVREKGVNTTPTSTNDDISDESSASPLSSRDYSAPDSPSGTEQSYGISSSTSSSRRARDRDGFASSQAAQESADSEQNIPVSPDLVHTETISTDKKLPDTPLIQVNAARDPGVDTVTQNVSRPKASDQSVQSNCSGKNEPEEVNHKRNGKIEASKDENQPVAVQEENDNQSKHALLTDTETVSTELAQATPDEHTNSDLKREASVNDSAEESQSLQLVSDGELRNDDTDGLIPMSLCGNLITKDTTAEQSLHLFDEHRIPYEDFIKNPEILYDPSVLFRIEGRLVSFKSAAPYVFSAACFRKNPDLNTLTQSAMRDGGIMPEAPKPPASIPARRFRWFSWSNTTTESSPGEGKEAEGIENIDSVRQMDRDAAYDGNGSPATVDDTVKDESVQLGAEAVEEAAEEGQNAEVETQDTEKANSRNAEETNDTPLETPNANVPGMVSFSDIDPSALSLVPTAEQLMQLELKPGPNTIRFIVESSSVELNCRIFLWSCHTKIVISDVDGTITRSDVLGHLLPAVGRDWSQVGVAGLYSQIEKNGYKILYLTARPIGQASQTRAFLHSVTQGSAKLPNGPVLMSPNRLVESFAREVIRRRPHEFKIAALRQVRSLFSPDYNPFHAGFGNRETDVISYRAVGLIPQRIFVVNTRGELAVMKARYESTASYSSLQDLVENVFPDISGRTGFEMIRAITDTATFNDWKWWKGSLPEVDFDALLGE